jgi:eukaryotic-like serine/threonine-protein kinase
MDDASVVLASRYRLDAQIAVGGIGEVWRARDLVLDRPVAVKVLRTEYAGQPEALARFRAEGRKAGSVSHPGIAQVYDYGEAGPASDLYALGVVGYECLTGAPPFRGAPVEVAAAHQHRPPPPPLPPAVPAAAAALVAEITAKDPAARPSSAAEVAERASRLRDALAGGAATALGELAGSASLATGLAAHPATLIDAHPPTWHDSQLPPWPGAQRPSWRDARPTPATRPRPLRRPGRASLRRRHGLLAAAGVVLVAGLGPWLLAALPASPGGHRAAPASHPASSPTVQTVQLNASDVVGQPVSAVSQYLSQLGLTPAISWVASNQDPGTVISVQPSGPVPVGSTVTVTAAFPAPGHHHHDGGQGGSGD